MDDRGSDLVVVAGRRATAVALLDVLRNWSSIGLIAPVYVVDLDAIRKDEALLPAMLLENGTTQGVLMQEDLLTRPVGRRVRLVAVTDLLPGPHRVKDSEAVVLRDAVTAALPGRETVSLHLITVARDGEAVGEQEAWLGWHNLVLAPENSPSPVHGVAPVGTSAPIGLRRTHAAAALASLAGLWADSPGSPMDDSGPAVGRVLTAVRTYSRHLSAASVQSQLLIRVADMTDGYPVPLVDGQHAAVLENPQQAAEGMCRDLFAQHPYVLAAERVPPPSKARSAIGALQALRMLLVFLGNALRNAPAAFMHAAVNKASSVTARAVTGLVFGYADPDYRVVVNGVDAAGRPASWEELDAALRTALDKVPGARSQEQAPADLADFWRDFVGGGMTLLDAGSRNNGLPPRTTGARRGVLLDPCQVVPKPGDVLPLTDASLSAAGRFSLPAWDVLTARTLVQDLAKRAEDDPHHALANAQSRTELEGWLGRCTRSYTGQVGRELAKSVLKVRAEVAGLVGALAELQKQLAVPETIQQQQRSLTRTLLGLTGAMLLALAVLMALVLGPLGWITGVALAIVVVIAWLITSTLVFLRGQRDLFALLHSREQATSQLEILQRFLAEAVADLRRLTRAYRQYGDWTAAFGAFVHRPLGAPPAEEDEDLLIGTGLPRNHRFGAARPDVTVLEEAATRLRAGMFQVAWLGDAWERFLKDVPDDLGSLTYQIRDTPRLLWDDTMIARESPLSTWSRSVAARQEWPGASRGLQDRVTDLIATHDPSLADRLLAQVGTRDQHGAIRHVDHGQFMDSLDRLPADVTDAQFDRQLFDPASSGEPWRVADTKVNRVSPGLGATRVVTQLSESFLPHALRGGFSLGAAALPGPDWSSPL